MNEEAQCELASHLRGINEALLSVARQLSLDPGADERARTIRSQLEWAASHLFEACRELSAPLGDACTEPAPDAADAQQASSPVRMMEGLKGHSEAVAIPEVLGFISSLRKSGVLRVHSSDESFLIELEEGAVVYAQGDNPPPGTMLGEILVSQGALTPGALDGVLDRVPDRSKALGRILVDEGAISAGALCIALAFQVQLMFHRMYEAEASVFQFDEGVQILEPRDIRLNVTSLLLESARTTDERAWDEEQSKLSA